MLNNFQGQPLTPTERALNRAAPGFASMLQSVQQFANRVEENRRLAEQRDFQRERDQTQFDNQIKLTEHSHKLNTQAKTELAKAQHEHSMAQIEERERVRLAGQRADAEFAASDAGMQATFSQTYATESGRFAARAPERQETRFNAAVTRFNTVVDKHPMLRNYEMLQDNQGNPVVVQNVRMVDGSVQTRIVTDAEWSLAQEEAHRLTTLGEGIDTLLGSADLTPENHRTLVELKTAINGGMTDYETAVGLYTRLAGRINQPSLSVTQQREAREQSQQANSALFMSLATNPQTGTVNPEFNRFYRELGKAIPDQVNFRTDEDLNLLLMRGRTLGAAAVTDQIRGHINKNYASIQTIRQTAEAQNFNRLIRRGNEQVPADPNKYAIYQNAGVLLTSVAGVSGTPSEPLFMNPFATSGDSDFTLTLDQLVQRLIEANLPPPPIEATVEEDINRTLNPFLARRRYITE